MKKSVRIERLGRRGRSMLSFQTLNGNPGNDFMIDRE